MEMKSNYFKIQRKSRVWLCSAQLVLGNKEVNADILWERSIFVIKFQACLHEAVYFSLGPELGVFGACADNQGLSAPYRKQLFTFC